MATEYCQFCKTEYHKEKYDEHVSECPGALRDRLYWAQVALAKYESHEQETCPYCLYYTRRNAEGECHRHPPSVLFVGGSGQRSFYPHVSHSDWCGDFKRKPMKDED